MMGLLGGCQTGDLTRIEPLTQARLAIGNAPAQAVNLPHYARQAHSGLIDVRWQLDLPPSIHQWQLPALLFPQPVQGLQVTVGDQLIYSVPASSMHTLHQWYRPILVPLPPSLIATQPNPTVQVAQTSHLRGWYVAPVLVGELNDLQPWHDRFLWLSSTLPATVNSLSVLVGLLMLALGWRTRNSTYAFGGLTTVIWGVLFSLALASELPTQAWFAWRLLLYACTGNLIYAVLRFLTAIFQQTWPGWLQQGVLLAMQLGWLAFAWAGKSVEAWLDVGWTALVVGIYTAGSLSIAVRGWQQRAFGKITALGLHAVFTALLAWHDYHLQAGEFSPANLPALSPLVSAWLLQPIYLTHLSLPVFVGISLWLLGQDHLRHRRERAQHQQALTLQRERIMRDIHDGVGARLNLMLWRTRTAPLVASQIEDELERSIEELRFAINPTDAANLTLLQALRSLCLRAQRWGQPQGVEVSLLAAAPDEAVTQTLSPECALHLYKATHEAVSNALRHSGARRISLQLSVQAHELQLVVEDDGNGIPGWNAELQSTSATPMTAMGLRGMQHRLQSIGGHCLIHSNANGTRLEMRLRLETRG